MSEEQKPVESSAPVLHPYCVALYHVFVLYALYEQQTPIDALLRPALISVALTALVLFGMRMLLGDRHKAGVFTSFLVVGLLIGWTILESTIRSLQPVLVYLPSPYGVYAGATVIAVITSWFFFRDVAPGRARKLMLAIAAFSVMNAVLAEGLFIRFFGRADAWFIATYLVGMLGSFLLLRRYKTDYASWTGNLNRFGGILVVLAVAIVALHVPRVERITPAVFSDTVPDSAAQTGIDQMPDIYFLVLGGYGRSDMLRSVYGYDNTPFIREMESRGFREVGLSMSNYNSPVLSLASCMNMEYLQDLVTDPKARASASLLSVAELFHHNRVYNYLKRRGYELIALPPGLELLEPRPDIVRPVTPPAYLNEFETVLLDNTVATRVVQVGSALGLTPAGDFQSIRERDRIRFVFDSVAEFSAVQQSAPRFVLAPVGVPEAPFLFSEDGAWNRETFLRSYRPGETYRGSKLSYIQSYLKQLTFTNEMIKKTVDAIQSQSKRPAVIVLASLNGPRSQRQGRQRTDVDMVEEYSNFVMVYFPPQYEGVNSMDWRAMSLVNLFRRVFNGVFQAEFEPRPNAQYISSEEQPLELHQATFAKP